MKRLSSHITNNCVIKKRKITKTYFIVPNDVLIKYISNNLDLNDIISLSLLSKKYNNIFTHKYFWYERFKNDFNNNYNSKKKWEENYKDKLKEFKSIDSPKRKLLWAISNSYYPLVKKLINKYLITHKFIFDDTFDYLNNSINGDDTKIFKLLKSYIIDFKIHINNLICSVCKKGYINFFEYLSKYNKNFDITDENGNNLLTLACNSNNYELVENLLKKEADPNKKNKDNTTALYHTASIGNLNIIILLEKYGVNINPIDSKPPITIAAMKNHINIVKYFLNNSININQNNYFDFSPLYVSSQEGHFDIVELLLSKSWININDNNYRGYTPLYVAARNGHKNIVKLLISRGANPNSIGGDSSTPLYVASQNGFHKVVKLLLKNNVNADNTLFSGYTPLYIASQNGHSKVINELLKIKNIDVNRIVPNGSTALYVASQNGHYETVKLLLEFGANVSLYYSNGSNPLFKAAQKGHIGVVKILLENGTDVNIQTDRKATPLYIACQKNHIDVVKLLLNSGADINIQFENGYTPLHIACVKNNKVIIKILLENGADKTIKDNNGRLPLELCYQKE